MRLLHPSENRQGQIHELARYALVIVLGLGIDIGAGLALRWLFAVPLVVAGAAGFCVGVAVNYWLCETWVFQTGQLALRRLGQAYLAGLAALTVRIAAIWVCDSVWFNAAIAVDLAKLAGAAGLSFVVNFLLLHKYLR